MPLVSGRRSMVAERRKNYFLDTGSSSLIVRSLDSYTYTHLFFSLHSLSASTSSCLNPPIQRDRNFQEHGLNFTPSKIVCDPVHPGWLHLQHKKITTASSLAVVNDGSKSQTNPDKCLLNETQINWKTAETSCANKLRGKSDLRRKHRRPALLKPIF